MEKIEKIRMNFTNDVHNMPDNKSPTFKSRMTCFELATSDELRKLIINSPSKTCDLDPIPSKLLKSCLDVLLVPITQMVNLSLISGVFPNIFKSSHVMPLLKKPSLSKDDMKNCRPVSNLNFVSKVIANRIRSHLERKVLSNQYQSAYKKFHSIETALLKVENDIILNLDEGRVTALTLLDLSAAFDTLDHSSIACGVPHGSVLGTLLFTLYTTPLSYVIQRHNVKPLSYVIQRHNVKHHLYADDTQIYLSLSLKNPDISLETLTKCLQDVSSWMSSRKLKLNPDKTDFLLIGSKVQRENFLKCFTTKLLAQEVTPSPSARNLGIVFDSALNFKSHISGISRACSYHIRDMRRIRRFLTPSAAKTIFDRWQAGLL